MGERRRIQVVGASGAGKSTVGALLAARTGGEYLELDAIYHQAGWTPLGYEALLRRIEPVLRSDRWVIDGNYEELVGARIRERADTLIWLDLPRWQVTARVARRSVLRAARRTELWNGNREGWRNLFSRDRRRNMILWTWTQHRRHRVRYTRLAGDPVNSHLEILRFESQGEVDRFLAGLGP